MTRENLQQIDQKLKKGRFIQLDKQTVNTFKKQVGDGRKIAEMTQSSNLTDSFFWILNRRMVIS